MSRFPAIRKGDALVPTTQDGREEINRLPHGAEVMVSVATARNARQFRLYWALCDLIADNSEIYDTKRKASDALLYFTGHVNIWFDHLGRMHVTPKSLAWENMPAQEFDEFFRSAVNFVGKLLGNAPSEILDQINQMIEPQSAQHVSLRSEPAKEIA